MTFPDFLRLLGMADASQFATLMAAALLGGLVRGFTGFGFAMVFVPLATVVVGPVGAVGLVWAIDAPFALPLAARVGRKAQWSEVLPLLAGATALLPLGVWLLTRLDPLLMRWIIALLILSAVSVLASGWRYHGQPSTQLSIGVGGLSGLAGGLASVGGIPLAIFWLSSQRNTALQMRYNLVTYFALSAIISGAILAWNEVVTFAVIRQALVLMIPYGLGLAIGTQGFRRSSDLTFRRAAYAIIATSALIALPALDPLLRR
jgi:uncharacterized membrane protein YfcA